jgi:predicted DsbA family dithiol-disulfide isomerase
MTESAGTVRVRDGLSSPSFDKTEVLHWFDFICPFCYVSQNRDELLVASGFSVAELPFQAHPGIPTEGILVGPRRGPMYEGLERQAEGAGLTLRWPACVPNSGTALAASAWIRRTNPGIARRFNARLFNAHFALGQDLGDVQILIQYAVELGVDADRLRVALADGSASNEVSDSEAMARGHGVRGTPAWLLNETLIEGVIPVNAFSELVGKARAKIA